jgi:hypothetical protein
MRTASDPVPSMHSSRAAVSLEKPDFSAVVINIIIIALAILVLLTFELWVSHYGTH